MSQLNSLNKLKGAIPVANERAAAAVERSRSQGMRSAVAAAPSVGVTKQGVQALGTQQAAQSGQNALGAQQANIQSAGAAGQTALVENQTQLQEQVSTANLSSRSRIHDSTMQEMEAKLQSDVTNEESMMAFTLWEATSGEDFAAKKQQAQQAHQTSITMMEVYGSMLDNELKRAQQMSEAGKDNKHALLLAELKRKNDAEMQKALDKQANSELLWTVGIGAATAVATVYGGPAGGAAASTGGQVLKQQSQK